MRPVQQAAEVVPLVHATKADSIPDTDRDPASEIDVMGYEQGLAIAHVEDKSLMARAFVVVRHQAPHDPGPLDPRA